MNDLRDRLKTADPVAGESPLSATDVQRMRHAVLTAVEESRPAWAVWRTAWTLAAIAVVSVIVGVDRWLEQPRPTSERRPSSIDADMAQTSAPRQIQFQTPGGTRVIWVFNPDFRP